LLDYKYSVSTWRKPNPRRIKMRKKTLIIFILLALLIPTSVALADAPLIFETTYSIAYDPSAQKDSEGRSLVWIGTVTGAYEGDIEWWMHFPEGMVPTGRVNHWEDAKWIIYPRLDDEGEEKPYIMGLEWGTTTDRPKNAKWRANGKVIAASEEFEHLIGRPMHDGGLVDWFPFPHGTGKLRINN
jgi:hypothetical protein